MKDLRPSSDASRLAEIAKGSTAQPAAGGAITRRRIVVALLVAGALAIVIGPHLLDAHRISSVADRAAQEAGGPTSLPVSACPSRVGLAPKTTAASPVVLTAAVVCRYGSGQPGEQLAAAGAVPAPQLAILNADLRAHVSPNHLPLTHPVGMGGPAPTWFLIGLTPGGQRVDLVGTGQDRVMVWSVSGLTELWRPSAQVQQLLAAETLH